MTKVSIIDMIAKKLRRCIAIVEDGDTASQAIASGKFVIWKGNPCKASTAISAGATLSGSNLTALSDGIGNELNGKIANIGTIVNGTNASSLVVATATYATICSLVLSPGTWIIIAGHQWNASFDNVCVDRILAGVSTIVGSTIRYSGSGGGGTNIAIFVTPTAETTYNLSVYQTSGSNKTANEITFRAMRIA